MALTDRLARGVTATFGANVVDALSNALLVIVLTRFLLTPEGYGRLNFVLSAIGVVSIFATLGLHKSAARYVTEFVETAPGQVPHVLRYSFVFVAVLVALVAGGTAAFGGDVARFVGAPSLAPFVLVGSVYVAARAFSGYCSALFQGFNRVTWSAVVGVVSGVGRFAFVVAFVALGYGVAGALAGYAVAAVAAAVVGGVVLYRRFYAAYEAAEEAAEGLARRILEYSVPLTTSLSANVLDKKVDVLLVGALLNMPAVGFYTIAKQVSDVVAMPATSLGFTVSPAIGEQKRGDTHERAARLYERSLEYVLLLYVPGVVGLVLVAGPMVRYVFGTDYLPAVPVVQVYSGFIFVNAVNKVTSDALDYLGRARSRAIVRTTMAVGNFGLNLVLIPWMGVVGAAVATVATYTVYVAANLHFIRDELPLDGTRVLTVLGITCLVTGGMAAVVAFALPYVSGLATLFAVVGLGVATWATLSVVGGLLDVRDVRRLLG